MGKKEKKSLMQEEGLHEIKNKRRPRAVKKRKKGVVLTAKKRRRALKACALVSVAAISGAGIWLVAALMGEANRNVVDDGFVTVSYELPTDGSTPDLHSALENIGYMNARFKAQTNWYSEMHGTTVAMGFAEQSVNTWKQYDDGILIMADITMGTVSAARQFCYVGDEVMWREAASSKFDGLNTVWKTGEPYAHMTVGDFKKINGLPGTELFVYIINEETLLNASEVTVNADGTYSQTYYLDPARDKAPAHYINQMIFTGGIKDADFNYITVTYTFDATWQILRADIEESYEANMGLNANCVSNFSTVYAYNTEQAKSSAYQDYFEQYVGKDIGEGGGLSAPTAMGSLAEAFGCVLTEPTVFDVTLELEGKTVQGCVYVDISKLDLANFTADSVSQIVLRADLGAISLWLENGEALLEYGGLKVKLSVDDLIEIVKDLIPEKDASADGDKTDETEEITEEEPEEEKDLLSSLFIIPEDGFVYDETKATLNATLDLNAVGLGLKIPVRFAFDLEKVTTSNGREYYNITLGGVNATIELNEDSALQAALRYGNKAPAALGEDEKAAFIDLMPYVDAVIDLVKSQSIRADIAYAGDGFAVTGYVNAAFDGEAKATGELTLTVGQSKKTVAFAYEGELVYIDLDGVKVSANVKEAVALIERFLTGEEDSESAEAETSDGASDGFSISKLLNGLFDGSLSSHISLTEEQSTLAVAVKGTELLGALGINFELGDVELSLNNEYLAASVYGVTLSVTKGEAVAVDRNGYIELVKYAGYLADLFTGEAVTAEVSYNAGGLAVNGGVTVALKPIAVWAEFTVAYDGAEKAVSAVYAEDTVYLTVDRLKLKLDAGEAAALVASLVNIPDGDTDAFALLEKVLAINYGELLSLKEETQEIADIPEGEERQFAYTLFATLNGTKLLNVFGVNFELGDVSLTLEQDALRVSALGAEIGITAGGEVKLPDPADGGYADLTPLAGALPAVLKAQGIAINGSLQMETNGFTAAAKIEKGVIEWGDGFRVCLDLTLTAAGTEHNILLEATDAYVSFVYGAFAAKVEYSDLPALEEALTDLYNRIAYTVKTVAQGKDVLPAIDSLKDLLSLIGGNAAIAGAMSGLSAGGVIEKISLTNSTLENGLLAVKAGGFTLDLVDETGNGGFVALKLSYADDTLSLNGDLGAEAADDAAKENKMPDNLKYLGVSDFADLLDYVGAAVEMLHVQNSTISVTGQVLNSNEKYAQYGGVQYEVTAKLEFYSGGSFPVHLDIDGRTFWLNTDMYAHINFEAKASDVQEDSIVCDAYVLDLNKDGSKDGKLDLYVQASRIAKEGVTGADGENAHNPVSFYIPMDEFAQLLASAGALFGDQISLLQSDFVQGLLQNCIGVTTTKQLAALGSGILGSLGLDSMIDGIVNGLLSGLGGESTEVKDYTSIIKAFELNENSFTLQLDGGLVFGEGCEDLTIGISKATQPDSELKYLTCVSVQNVRMGDGKEQTLGLTFTNQLGEVEMPDSIALEGQYYDVRGLAKLIAVLAETMTHAETSEDVVSGEQTEHNYRLNKTFYIEGVLDITINLGLIKINAARVKLVAISVNIDENNEFAINVRLQMDQGIAFAANTTTDITIKGNMIYIRRDAGDVIYRAMPLENFVADIMNQLSFALNFTSTVTKAIESGMNNSGGTTTEGRTDFGTEAAKILSSFTYTANASGGEWNVGISDDLTGGIVKNFIVVLTEKDGVLDGITADGSIYGLLLIHAELNYKNPRGIAIENQTTDVSSILISAMSEKLAQCEADKWEGTTYLEGRLGNVKYTVDGVEIGSQQIVYHNNEAFANIIYPDTTIYEREGYRIEWSAPQETGSSEFTVNAIYVPNLYWVRFESKQEIDGWTEQDGVWIYEVQMKYGSKISFCKGEEEFDSYTVGVGENTVLLPEFTDGRYWSKYEISEDGARLRSYLNPDVVRYVSEVSFTYNNTQYDAFEEEYEGGYTLITPTAEGYTFLGWYVCENGVWNQVTDFEYLGNRNYEVEALWQKTKLKVDSVDFKVSGFGSYTSYVTVHITDCELVGAWANDASIVKNTKYKYVVKTATINQTISGEADSNSFSVKNSFNVPNGVSVTVITSYATSDGRILYSESAEGSK